LSLLRAYEYGNKVSIVSTKDNNIIVGVVSHDKNIHDSKTLDAAITHANSNRTKPIRFGTLFNRVEVTN
jgi:IS5 family transposase